MYMEVDEVAEMVMDMEVNTVADKASNMVMKLPFITIITIIIVVIIVTVKRRFLLSGKEQGRGLGTIIMLSCDMAAQDKDTKH